MSQEGRQVQQQFFSIFFCHILTVNYNFSNRSIGEKLGGSSRRENGASKRREGQSDTKQEIIREVFELKTIQIEDSFELNEIGITVLDVNN